MNKVMTDTDIENKEILKRYKGLLRACKPFVDKEGRRKIRKAFNLALSSHEGMRRKSGEPYIYHPIAVARITAEEIGLGTTSIICALLHDVVEDTDITLEDIEGLFEKNVANIIDGLTKLDMVAPDSKSMQAENFRKILLTIADDVRVILIKIADRLHNMRTLDSMPSDKQLKISSETLFVYAPIAHRLGLYSIKSELEDLGLKYTYPDVYSKISEKLKETEKDRRLYINNFIRPIRQSLNYVGLETTITGRHKSRSSIWNKMKVKNVSFEEVFDIFAIRIITKSKGPIEKADCWKIYSLVTELYTPNPDRLRDWISVPKSNGYEALHTTVMGPKGKWVEVQIRSERMDQVAEKGIAAHWRYKGVQNEETAMDDWLKKVREIIENPEADSLQFLDNIKLNLFSNEIYVFTRDGNLKVVPSSASALDLAYNIHTDLGNKCLGAKVNHKIVPINYKLKNGDQVEIITSEIQQPTEEWLDFVVTAKARSNIKQLLNRERRGIARLGKQILENKFKSIKATFNKNNIINVVNFYHKINEIDLFYEIGLETLDLKTLDQVKINNGKILLDQSISDVVNTNVETDLIIRNTLQKNADLLIFGSDEEKIKYGFAKCCNPIPGNEVVSIDISNKLDIHKTSCPRAIELMSKYGNKIIKTKWTNNRQIAFLTGLKVTGIDEVAVMHHITTIISVKLKINMRSISIDSSEGQFIGDLIVYIHDTVELNNLIGELKVIPNILSVELLDNV
ncbi:MAG TPA: bifunctional (p)ppGpp synthetase/guanosine-3',5'-bis(diphosphate) 3'-pyrophosphohydrolase [Bacteroidetes bacterium]|nr:bifunctional (p)ppGpp synthetase/guanosine-3',5'-bis(diphosphate) 3'-pyrophosphohydrolase [Bacteroidota bacterium]